MTIVYECGKCNHEFTLHEVYCEDYRDPKKSFMCPKCHTALKIEKKYNRKKLFLILGLSQLIGLIFQIVFKSYASNHNPTALIVFGILFIVFIIATLIYRSKYGYKNIKTSIAQP